MKIIAVFMMCVLVQVSAATYSQTAKLTLNLRDVTLADLFTKIEQTSEFHFFYDSGELDLSRMVSVNTENTGIESILKEVFRNSDLTYEIFDRYIIIKSKSREEAVPASVSSQQSGRIITGKVTDINRLPMPGVTVVVKGTTRGTITNEAGEFSLDNIPQGAVLHFSFVGMKPLDLEVSNQSRFNVTLQEETIGLEEGVAIGYGVQKKSDITGAVASVSSEDLNKIATSTPVQALQGKAAGVSVIMESGSPDATASIKIRGVGTTNNTDPLYVVDGLPMSDIDYLNSNDIESMRSSGCLRLRHLRLTRRQRRSPHHHQKRKRGYPRYQLQRILWYGNHAQRPGNAQRPPICRTFQRGLYKCRRNPSLQQYQSSIRYQLVRRSLPYWHGRKL